MNSRLQQGRKAFQSGMRCARLDIDECGIDYAIDRHRYGLAGESDTFCRGYNHYIAMRMNNMKIL